MPSGKAIRGEMHLCGLSNWHPPWMQRFANMKMFMAVYGLLGTIQAMSYMYFIVTLTTIEKRFKIPSQTTGIILSGNEISQILLSLILSYVGGQRNRPRWIAWGIVFCGISCFILALPHFIYGAGEESIQLTQEYIDSIAKGHLKSISLVNQTMKHSQQLCESHPTNSKCDKLLSLAPLILIFISQFVLGIGNTMYYSLGQTYLDDNTKKTNTPLMLAYAMSLRMIGPIVGFFLGYLSLNMFIDITKTPVIDRKDPRWLGAWWFGWIILGTGMLLFSGLMGLFPKELPKKKPPRYHSEMPHALRHEELLLDEGLPLSRGFSSNTQLEKMYSSPNSELSTLKDFPVALMRLLRNKLLMFNIISGVFYILGASGYITFLTKYMEVQFHKSAQNGTIVVGPVSIAGMVTGLIGSGLVISKKKPKAGKVLMWNVIVGGVYILGQICYTFLYCGDAATMLVDDGKLNLTAQCNKNCYCDGVPYSPVCHADSETTYFSPCHAGCHSWNSNAKTYSNCSCVLNASSFTTTPPKAGPSIDFTTELPKYPSEDILAMSSSDFTTTSILMAEVHSQAHKTNSDLTTTSSTITTIAESPYTRTSIEDFASRNKRSAETFDNILNPGPCLKGCTFSFWAFSITSMVVNWFGSSGRIGNLLVNYRCVSTEDKSFAQGLTLMMVSLFALIPGPIIYGRVIDSTCLVWTKTCGGNGNCQLYDQRSFRQYVNAMAVSLTTIGVFFDVLVWYYGRHLDLYGEREAQRMEEIRKRNKPITPLASRK